MLTPLQKSTNTHQAGLASSIIISTLFLNALISPVVAFCGSRLPHLHHKVMHKRQSEEGLKFEEPRFSYDTTTGPLLWHTIDQEFALCRNGSSQSPINLETLSTTKAPEASVILNMPPATNVEFLNLGTTVEVAATGSLQTGDDITGVAWDLAQFHFHCPSEHRIDLEHFDCEMHMVFKAADNAERVAVVAFPIEAHESRTTDVLESVFANLSAIQQVGQSVSIPELNFSSLMRKASKRSFFRYTGSLTTPPCSEGVQWYVATRPLKLSTRSFQALRRTTKMNNRFTQTPVQTENILLLAVKDVDAVGAGELPEEGEGAGIPEPATSNEPLDETFPADLNEGGTQLLTVPLAAVVERHE